MNTHIPKNAKPTHIYDISSSRNFVVDFQDLQLHSNNIIEMKMDIEKQRHLGISS